MRITKSNFKEIIPQNEQLLLKSLLTDLEEINARHKDNVMYIDWQNYHNEYSAERVDPCPDYYGYYTLRFEKYKCEIVGEEMTIDELDSALLLLSDYSSFLNIKS
jgi:hypothetical protein